ncbi:MAG: hypothetical protein WBE78_08890 [Candidatus Binataceae bacterium]
MTSDTAAILRQWLKYFLLPGAVVGLAIALVGWVQSGSRMSIEALFEAACVDLYYWHLVMLFGFILDLPRGSRPDQDFILKPVAATVSFAGFVAETALSVRFGEFYGFLALSPLLLGIGIVWERRSDEVRLTLAILWLGLMIASLHIVGPGMVISVPFVLLVIYYTILRLRGEEH